MAELQKQLEEMLQMTLVMHKMEENPWVVATGGVMSCQRPRTGWSVWEREDSLT